MLINWILSLFLLQQSPAAPVLNLTGGIEASGTIKSTGGFILPDNTVLSNLNRFNERQITFLSGCDKCAVLPANDEQRRFFQNLYSNPLKIITIVCYTNSGNVSVTIERDDGSPQPITTTPILCTPAGTLVVSFSADEGLILPGDRLNYKSVAAGDTNSVTIHIGTTIP